LITFFLYYRHDSIATSENNDSTATTQKKNATGPQQSTGLDDHDQSIPKQFQSPGALISSAFVNIRTIHAFSMQQSVSVFLNKISFLFPPSLIIVELINNTGDENIRRIYGQSS